MLNRKADICLSGIPGPSNACFAVVILAAEVPLGRIVSIADDDRGFLADEVHFRFGIYPNGNGIVAANA